MPKIRQTPERTLRAPGAHRNPVIARAGDEWAVSVCSFEFVFARPDEIEIYLRWFENFGNAHRRQYDIIDRHPLVRGAIVKLPARLFKTSNRPRVIRALRELLHEYRGRAGQIKGGWAGDGSRRMRRR